MKKQIPNSSRIRFYSAKVTSIQKSPQITHRTHGDSSQSPYPYHTHTHGNPHGNPHTHGSPVYISKTVQDRAMTLNNLERYFSCLKSWWIQHRGISGTGIWRQVINLLCGILITVIATPKTCSLLLKVTWKHVRCGRSNFLETVRNSVIVIIHNEHEIIAYVDCQTASLTMISHAWPRTKIDCASDVQSVSV